VLTKKSFSLFIYFISVFILLGGCATGRGTRGLVSDLGTGTSEYRGITGEIRDGQAELGITGARIEERSGELERSISRGAETIQSIRAIIQQVRGRPVEAALVEEWRNRQSEK